MVAVGQAGAATASRRIEVRDVSKVFADGGQALANIDLTVRVGEFVAILGPSGCGKSTLLRIIAGLDRPTEGEVSVDTASIAFVFQDAHLLPWRTVLDNVALPLELRGVDRAARVAAARRAIADVDLHEAISQYPAQLSGGMRMRVSIARALVNDPAILLLDEPFAALDEITRLRLDEKLRALWADRGMTVLFVTHSTMEAAFLAERAVVLSRRPGRIVHDEPIALGRQRGTAVRGEPEFARIAHVLLSAIEGSKELTA